MPDALFAIVDGRLSRCWQFNIADRGIRDGDIIFAFPEWARAPYEYYGALTDGKEPEVSTFKRYKAIMDAEYPNVDVTVVGEKAEDSWVLCPKCHEAWQVVGNPAMLTCPSCGTLEHNPYYAEVDSLEDRP